MPDNSTEARQTGRTTNQMLSAPAKAIFVWCNDHIGYPRDLARAIGRTDLIIRPAGWLTDRNVKGRAAKQVVVDHALHPNNEQRIVLYAIQRRSNNETSHA